MSVACASRFAVLKLEDDEPATTKVVKNSTENNPETKTTETKTKGKKKKKKNSQDDTNELQSMAFGATKAPKSKSSQQQKSKSNQQGSEKQWEEWKKKDAEFVSETYEQDLEQALLLSKIEFEEKKDFYDNVQKEAEQSKSGNSNHRKKKRENPQKKDKPIPMTLEDFQNLPSRETSTNISKKDANFVQEKNVIVPDESDFFNKLEEDVEKIINQEQRQESYQRVQSYKDDQLRNIQYKDELEKKDQEIERLKEEIRKTKLQSKALKDRVKLMSKLLFQGEMQDKAKILVQVDKLTEVKDELTEQVAELHASLEQERSKVHALTTELKKFQNKKKENK